MWLDLDYGLLAKAPSRIEKSSRTADARTPLITGLTGVRMEQCSVCKAETQLYYKDIPICPSCCDAGESEISAMGQPATKSMKASAGSNSSESAA